MFNLSHPPAQNTAWSLDPQLVNKVTGDGRFNAQDWEDVPKLKYASALFRKLTPPKFAKVVDDPSEFELETYGAPLPESELIRKKALKPAPKDMGFESDDEKLSATAKAEDVPDSAMARAIAAFMGAPSTESTDAELPVDATESKAVQEPALQENLSAASVPESIEDSKDENAELAQQENQRSASYEEGFEEGKKIGLAEGLEQAQALAQAQSELAQSKTSEAEDKIKPLMDEIERLKLAMNDWQEKEQTWLHEKSNLQASIEGLDHAVASLKENQEKELETIKSDAQQALDAELAVLAQVSSKLEEFLQNPARVFEPMKRLSLHIAEQLVLAELNLSGASIERLIQRCLDELPNHGLGVVTVELNPQDKSRLEEMSGEVIQHIQLRSLNTLKPGSVRVISDEAQIDDFVNHRLEVLAHGLLGQPEEWKERSPFFRQPLAQRDTEIQDVRQRSDEAQNIDMEIEND